VKEAQFVKAWTLPELVYAISQKPFLEASYKFAYWIAKQKKSHAIGETSGSHVHWKWSSWFVDWNRGENWEWFPYKMM
jgi:hypothetical protein